MPIDYSISAEERYKEVIVTSHLQEDLEDAVIDFGNPRVTTKYGYNTRAVAKVTIGDVLRNCIALYVNRLNLDTFFSTNNFLTLNAPGAVTTHDALPFILSEHGVNLTPEDIVLEDLATTNYTINASVNSLGWLGSFQFNATIEIYPPLIRSTSNRLLVSRSGKFIRRSIPAYNP